MLVTLTTVIEGRIEPVAFQIMFPCLLVHLNIIPMPTGSPDL